MIHIVGLNSSTYYRWRSLLNQSQKPVKRKEGYPPGFSYTNDIPAQKVSDIHIQKYIKEILNDEYGMFYGYKKVTAVLRQQHNLKINKKKVYRLMAEMGVLKAQGKRIYHYKRICKNHEIKNSNALWEMDTKYIFIAKTRQVAYLASIIDVFDRSIISCVLSLSPNTDSAKETLLKALYSRGIKGHSDNLIVRTDNGSQFVAHDFERLCIAENITHERIPAKSPNYNAHIESYHRYLQDECLAGRLFENFEEAESTIMNYVNGYNAKRIHSSIGYSSPNAFYNLKNSNFKENLIVRL